MNVQNSRQSMRSEHRRHDRLLVTRFAMDDAYRLRERRGAPARRQLHRVCRAGSRHPRAFELAVAQLPDAKRTRDFMITAEKAEELRGSRLARWMRGLATPSSAMLRPVAGVALSIGLVMAIVGVAMPGTAPAGDNTFGAAEIAAATDTGSADGPGSRCRHSRSRCRRARMSRFLKLQFSPPLRRYRRWQVRFG